MAKKPNSKTSPGFRSSGKTRSKAKRTMKKAAAKKSSQKVGKGRTKVQQLAPKTTRRRSKSGSY